MFEPGTEYEQVLVPCPDGSSRRGWIVAQDDDEYFGKMFIIKFRSDKTARLAEREIVRQPEGGFATYFWTRWEAREWLAFDEGDREDDEESERKFFAEPDRFREWEQWRNCLSSIDESEACNIAIEAFRSLNLDPMGFLGLEARFNLMLERELDRRAARRVFAR